MSRKPKKKITGSQAGPTQPASLISKKWFAGQALTEDKVNVKSTADYDKMVIQHQIDSTSLTLTSPIYHQLVPYQTLFLMNLPVEILQQITDQVLGSALQDIKTLKGPKLRKNFIRNQELCPHDLYVYLRDTDLARIEQSAKSVGVLMGVTRFWENEVKARGSVMTARRSIEPDAPLIEAVRSALDFRRSRWILADFDRPDQPCFNRGNVPAWRPSKIEDD